MVVQLAAARAAMLAKVLVAWLESKKVTDTVDYWDLNTVDYSVAYLALRLVAWKGSMDMMKAVM